LFPIRTASAYFYEPYFKISDDRVAPVDIAEPCEPLLLGIVTGRDSFKEGAAVLAAIGVR
jgi:hypothetical protein